MAGDKVLTTAYSAAIRDYLVAPVIISVTTNAFTGAAGSTIPIKVHDNFKLLGLKSRFH